MSTEPAKNTGPKRLASRDDIARIIGEENMKRSDVAGEGIMATLKKTMAVAGALFLHYVLVQSYLYFGTSNDPAKVEYSETNFLDSTNFVGLM